MKFIRRSFAPMEDETEIQRLWRIRRANMIDPLADALLLEQYLTRLLQTKGKHGTRFLADDVTGSFLLDLMIRQDFKCAVSGIAFTRPSVWAGRRAPFAPSVDRIDVERQYERDNIRMVCLIVNLALNDFGDEAFHLMCRETMKKLDDVGHSTDLSGKP